MERELTFEMETGTLAVRFHVQLDGRGIHGCPVVGDGQVGEETQPRTAQLCGEDRRCGAVGRQQRLAVHRPETPGTAARCTRQRCHTYGTCDPIN